MHSTADEVVVDGGMADAAAAAVLARSARGREPRHANTPARATGREASGR